VKPSTDFANVKKKPITDQLHAGHGPQHGHYGYEGVTSHKHKPARPL